AQQLHGTGTIQPVSQASVAFPIAGVVATVVVTPGAQVTAGQTLATLDATSLQQDVITKQAALAAANLTLYKALNGQSSSPNGGGAGGATATAANTNASASSAAAPRSSADTSAAQQQLLAAQKNVDAALATAQASLQAASEACGTSTNTQRHSPGSPGASPTPPSGPPRTTAMSSVPASTTSTTAPTASKPPTTGLGSAACMTAQQQLARDQQASSTAQQSLARAEQTLERLLTSTATSSSSRTAGASASSTSTAPSAAQLVADQSAVDAAATEVLAAQESVAQATITSPITGTVAAVGLQVGHSVTASSTTSAVVVTGGAGYEISTTVSVNDIAKLKVGDAATVVPDATSQTLNGKVVWIGAASGSSTSTSYPVVIGLTGSPSGLRNGAMSSTSIELARSQTSALTVPTSAVHSINGRHFVTVLANGKTSTVPVQIGVVGAQTTQITSGVDGGTVVVLADLHAAVPSSNTNSRVTAGLTGGLGGNNLFGGGTGTGTGGGTGRGGIGG
ncbi:MAG: trimeric autotransporter adhesin, partial [Actinomycetota bacterium]|nr:trimeric autotransporter adhesin [Actinomycetota bacterium]